MDAALLARVTCPPMIPPQSEPDPVVTYTVSIGSSARPGVVDRFLMLALHRVFGPDRFNVTRTDPDTGGTVALAFDADAYASDHAAAVTYTPAEAPA